MGHEILYCSRCQVQLRGADFEKGRAFRAGALSFCRACAPAEAVAAVPLSPVTPKPRPALRESTPRSGTSFEAPPPASRSWVARAVVGGILAILLGAAIALAY